MNLKLRLTQITVALTFIVIVVGAYTRLVDAGLGCPDWPGCYGQLLAPDTHDTISAAQQLYPEAPVDISKARTEMFHRYLASTLGFLILVIAFLSFPKKAGQPFKLCLFLVAWVICQGLLGKWTVTMRLLPTVVMAHLLFGLTTLALLWILNLRLTQTKTVSVSKRLATFSRVTLSVLVLQIALGGWTSTNYSALVCPSFPFCGLDNIAYNFKEAFLVFGPIGLTPPEFHPDLAIKVTQQMIHRLGALITFVTLIAFAISVMRSTQDRGIKRLSIALKTLLFVQIALGIVNVVHKLPLTVAVLHNGVAALMLICMVTLCYKLKANSAGAL